jgi:spoIIIJ-associated protein
VIEEPENAGEECPAEGDEVVNEETLKIAANVVRDLLEKMRVKATIQSKIGEAADEVDSRVIMIDILGDDLSFLIGRHSEVLHSLQYITSLIVGREVGHWVPLIIDVQGYRERRERQLRQMAARMADQVAKTGRRISLEPMTATERRIIHLALRDNSEITTESIGEEPNRKVVIYPKDK